ncbi:transposase [Salinibacter ruber]|uniref:transposase n=1 Tax=Salinibacter ruber TaxID=146919 RepID=UPI0021697995
MISISVNIRSQKRKGVRLVFGQSQQAFPKTSCPNHAPEALQLRPLGSQWEQVKRYFTTGRRRKYHLRYHVLDAILYIVKTGTQWCMLPGEFAPWRAAHYYFRRWREEGRILYIFEHYVSRSPAPVRTTRRTERVDRGLPVSLEYANRWNQKLRRLQKG